MTSAVIDTDEFMEVWNDCIELRQQNKILNERMLQLEYRIQKMEEIHNE